MLIEQAKQKIERLRLNIRSRYASRLPFNGRYVDAFAAFLQSNLAEVGTRWDKFHADGDARKFVDALIDFARGNLRVPFYLRPFANMALEGIRSFLHANADVVRDAVGEVK